MAQQLGVLGIDMAKWVLHVVGSDESGPVVLRKRLARRELPAFRATFPPRRMGLAAGGSAQDWARGVREHGHDVRLIAPQGITADVKSPTHEARDAEAICEAVTRPTMRVVRLKRVAQPDRQARHRVWERLIHARTALINESHGRLNADGIILPHRLTKFRALIADQRHAEPATLPPRSAELFGHLDAELLAVETRLASDDAKLAAMGRAHPACQRLQTIPGVGPVTATALIAALGDVTPCKNGRQLAAWLGLVPREYATGGTPRLLGIRKRGHRYRRKLCVHGARATLRWVETTDDERSRWPRALIARRGKNRAAGAWANKHARIVWGCAWRMIKPVTAEDNGCPRLGWSQLPTARCTPTLMTRSGRPASPDSALRHGLRGRGAHEEEKRAWHQGPKALRRLHAEAG